MRRVIAALLASTIFSGAARAQQYYAPSPCSTYVGPGDIVSGAFAWWGLRAYSNAAIGQPIANIIRASDSLSMVVNSTITGGFDVAAATTFCASTTCKVSQLYDQTGNGHHLVQATGGNQPALNLACIGSGTLQPCLHFSVTPYMTVSATIVQPFTFSVVAERTSNLLTQSNIFVDAGNGIYFNNAANQIQSFFNTGFVNTAASVADSTFHGIQFVGNAASSSFVIDGVTTTGNWGSNGYTTTIALGASSAGGGPLGGDISEAGIWLSSLSGANLTALNSNQHVFWGF